MKEIKYELNEFDKATIKCNYYPQIMVGSVKCIVCAFNNGKNKKDNIVYCNFDESFLGHCLAALNWQRGDEADIIKVLKAAREYIVLNEKLLAIDCEEVYAKDFEENTESYEFAISKLTKAIQEPTDAKA